MIMRRRSEAGVSILEIMIALVVLSFAILMLMSLMLSSNRLQQSGREKTIAYNAARQKIEEIRTVGFTAIYDTYKTGGSVGPTFTVPGLAPPPGTLFHGEILFPEETKGGGLCEDLTDAKMDKLFGLPKDLNRNASASDTALPGDAVGILPILIRIRWQTQGGDTVDLDTVTLISGRGE